MTDDDIERTRNILDGHDYPPILHPDPVRAYEELCRRARIWLATCDRLRTERDNYKSITDSLVEKIESREAHRTARGLDLKVCPHCEGKGCDHCIDKGVLWDDDVPLRKCPDSELACGRSLNFCPGCGRSVEEIK